MSETLPKADSANHGSALEGFRIGASLSVTTVIACFLYCVGYFYLVGYYGHYGLDVSLLKLPIREVLFLKQPAVFLVYHAVLVYIGSAVVPARFRLGSGRNADSDGPNRFDLVLGSVSALLLLLSAVFFRDNLMPFLGGALVGGLLLVSRRFDFVANRVIVMAIGLILICTFSSVLGERDARSDRPREVSYCVQGGSDEEEKGLLIAYDHENYFISDFLQAGSSAKRRMRMIGKGEVLYVEYTFE